LQKRAVL